MHGPRYSNASRSKRRSSFFEDSLGRALGRTKLPCEDPETPDNSLPQFANWTRQPRGILMRKRLFRTDGNLNELRLSDACELHKNRKMHVFETLPAF